MGNRRIMRYLVIKQLLRLWGTLMVFLLMIPVPVSVAGLIVAYNSVNNSGGLPASEQMSGVTALDLSRGPGILPNTSGDTYNSRKWTADSVIDADDFLQWGWSFSPTLNLTDLDIRYDRSGAGPTQLEIRLSINGGTFATIFTDNDISLTGENNFDIDITGFTNVTSATFRLFAFNASATTTAGTFDIENFSTSPNRGILVNGTPIPEPSTFLLCCLAVFGILGYNFYRRLAAGRRKTEQITKQLENNHATG